MSLNITSISPAINAVTVFAFAGKERSADEYCELLRHLARKPRGGRRAEMSGPVAPGSAREVSDALKQRRGVRRHAECRLPRARTGMKSATGS